MRPLMLLYKFGLWLLYFQETQEPRKRSRNRPWRQPYVLDPHEGIIVSL